MPDNNIPVDLSGMSDADVQALASGQMDKLSDQGLHYLVAAHSPLVQTHGVPLGGGMAADGSATYLDKSLPATVDVGGKQLDPRPFLRLHENTEWSHMQAGADYNTAHQIATQVENTAVKHAGYDPVAYEQVLAPWITKARSDVDDIPDDLDPQPYDQTNEDNLIAHKAKVANAQTVGAPQGDTVGPTTWAQIRANGGRPPPGVKDTDPVPPGLDAGRYTELTKPSPVESFFENMMAAPTQLAAGLLQRAGNLGPAGNLVERAGNAIRDQAAAAPGADTTAGKVGNVVGNMGTLGAAGGAVADLGRGFAGVDLTGLGANVLNQASKLPLVGRFVKPIAAGIATAAVEPTQDDQTVGGNIQQNALTSALLTPVVGGANRVLSGLSDRIPQAAKDSYESLRNAGIDTNLNQLTGSTPLGPVGRLIKLVGTAASTDKSAEQSQQINRAVAKTFGESTNQITPQTLGAAQARIGNVIERATAGEQIPIGQGSPLRQDLEGLLADQQSRPTALQSPKAIQTAQELLGVQAPNPAYQRAIAQANAAMGQAQVRLNAQMQQQIIQAHLQAAGNPPPMIEVKPPKYGNAIPGEVYQQLRSEIGTLSNDAFNSGNTTDGRTYSALVDSLDKAAMQTIRGKQMQVSSPTGTQTPIMMDKADALEAARQQYRNLMAASEATSRDNLGNVVPREFISSIYKRMPDAATFANGPQGTADLARSLGTIQGQGSQADNALTRFLGYHIGTASGLHPGVAALAAGGLSGNRGMMSNPIAQYLMHGVPGARQFHAVSPLIAPAAATTWNGAPSQ